MCCGPDAQDDRRARVRTAPTPPGRAAAAGSCRRSPRRCRLPPLATSRPAHEVHRRRAEEAGDEAGGRALEQVERRALLLDPAVAQQHDAVGQRHRLDLVMGDVDHGLAQLLVQALDLAAHLVAQLGIEVGQRLVEQEQPRVAHDGAADGHALPLAAGQLARIALEQVVDAEHLGGALHLARRSRPSASCARAGRRRCCRTPSCRDRARSSGTPWRCRGRAAARR